jgi:uncharacterized protein YjbI with pentapeptide repeats
MADKEHLERLNQGVSVWNAWRQEHPDIQIDLTEADLRGVDLTEIDFSKAWLNKVRLIEAHLRDANLSGALLWGADLSKAILSKANFSYADLSYADLSYANFTGGVLSFANFSEANLHKTDLRWAELFLTHGKQANLSKANLYMANLRQANLKQANLSEVDLSSTNLRDANLTQADLTNADLSEALLIRTNLQDAKLNYCRIYGISAWDLNLVGAEQSNLIITPEGEPTITVDNLKVAQFIYLLLNNAEIRDVIDTITSKVVLILGRFTLERKAILDAIRDELRHHDLLPVLFDFQKPESQSFIETVSTLAHMARFVIADMTEPRIVLEEIPHIMRNIAVPLVPLLLEGEEEPVTLYNLRRNHRSLLPTCRYTDRDDLLASMEKKVIIPAQAKTLELREIR